MLYDYLKRFNLTLESFNKKFPKTLWTDQFKSNLINDYTFYSARIENENIQYGDTIRFLNGELVKKSKMKSLLDISNHKDVLESLINKYDTFKLSESTIKNIHKDLMSNELAWETSFKPHLIGNYRNIPTIGVREPFFKNKEYVPHYNISFAMASYLDNFIGKFEQIDNTKNETHIISVLSFFHNIFLNKIHPFADGNGRVCRIVMGIILMKNNCPPVFVKITSDEDRFEYIHKIVECENSESNQPLIKFLANGMSEYMEDYISKYS